MSLYIIHHQFIYLHETGIYIGDDKVIHFTRGQGQEFGIGTALDFLLVSSAPKRPDIPCPNCTTQLSDSHGVVSSCLDCFLAGGDLYRFEYSVTHALFLAKARGGTCTLAPSDADDAVIKRANYLLVNGFRCYNVFNNNCEDFAIYCKTGLLVAEKGVLGQSGQVISIGSSLAAFVPTPFRLLTTNVYGMVMRVGTYYVNRYLADVSNRRDVVKVEVEDLGFGGRDSNR